MATTTVSQALNRGGAFLIASTQPEDVFTPADLNDDQRLLGRTIEEFMAKEVAPNIPELEKHKEGLMAELVRKSGKLGCWARGFRRNTAARRWIKYRARFVGKAWSVFVFCGFVRRAHGDWDDSAGLLRHGRAEEEIFAEDCERRNAGVLCAFRTAGGSDALAARSRAVLSPDGKNWLLSGQKMWITSGGFSDLYTVFAKVDGEKFRAFLVERGTPGFSIGAEENKMGIRGSSTVPLFFENAPCRRRICSTRSGAGTLSRSTR